MHLQSQAPAASLEAETRVSEALEPGNLAYTVVNNNEILS